MKRKKRKKYKFLIILLVFFMFICLLLTVFYLYIKDNIPDDIEVLIGQDFNQQEYLQILGYNINIITDEKIDTSKIGAYNLDYSYNYLFLKFKKKINVKVIDKTGPQFVEFNDKQELFVGETYYDEEYVVIDNIDSIENITIEKKGEVDTTKVGDYYIVYIATDMSGNKSEQVKKVTVSERPTIDFSAPMFNLSEYFPETILKQTEMMDSNYMNNVYFAGDSVFWNFTKFNIYNSSRVWAKPCTDPNNIYVQKVEVNNVQSSYTIPELIEKNNPKYLILSIGGCQTQDFNVDLFIEQYTKFLIDMKNKHKDTKIIVQTFGPVIESSAIPLHKNSNRNKYNYYITRMCEKLEIPVMDISMILKDSNGNCKTNLCMSDGFHPNVRGMNLIIDYVKTHGYKEEE